MDKIYRFSFAINYDCSGLDNGYNIHCVVILFENNTSQEVESYTVYNLTIEQCIEEENKLINKYSNGII
jgi:hypothetical protein